MGELCGLRANVIMDLAFPSIQRLSPAESDLASGSGQVMALVLPLHLYTSRQWSQGNMDTQCFNRIVLLGEVNAILPRHRLMVLEFPDNNNNL
jgi:hypothetical protein